MAVGVGAVVQFPNGVIIRNDKAFEAPFLAQHVAEQPFARVRRHAVNLVVARHHADRAALLEAVLERMQKSFAQHAFGDVHRRAVLAGFRLAVRGEMFQRGDDALLVLERRVALESAHGGDAELRVEIRDLRRRFPRRGPSAGRAPRPPPG